MARNSSAPAARRQLTTEAVVATPAGVSLPAGVTRIVVRRSERRHRTVAARREGERIVVLLPARMRPAEEDRWIAKMVTKITSRESKTRNPVGDDELEHRAIQLSEHYLDGRARPRSVRWVSNQTGRWGSCTPAQGTIRLSDRMRPMPSWVIDYVLLHELIHLIHPDHSPQFHAELARYEKAERAQGFLDGWTAAHAQGGDHDLEPEHEI